MSDMLPQNSLGVVSSLSWPLAGALIRHSGAGSTDPVVRSRASVPGKRNKTRRAHRVAAVPAGVALFGVGPNKRC